MSEKRTAADAGGFRRGMRVRNHGYGEWMLVVHVDEGVALMEYGTRYSVPERSELDPTSVWEGQVRCSENGDLIQVTTISDYTGDVYYTKDAENMSLGHDVFVTAFPTVVWPEPEKPEKAKTLDDALRTAYEASCGTCLAQFEQFISVFAGHCRAAGVKDPEPKKEQGHERHTRI